MSTLWDRDNLIAWCVVGFDARERDANQRAEMLGSLGFRMSGYDGRPKDTAAVDAELAALRRRGIELVAWLDFEPDSLDPTDILEAFRRNGVAPQWWVMQRLGAEPATPHDERLTAESERIRRFATAAAAYGCRIGLYNHNGWFGMPDNQLAIIERLAVSGVTNVGIVYNFNGALDADHDDTADFPAVWTRIRPHVLAVNVTGIGSGVFGYPSQGNRELEMMRTIADSGWRGPVGVFAVDMDTARRPDDAELVLQRALDGVDWLAAELRLAGSGGARPFEALA